MLNNKNNFRLILNLLDYELLNTTMEEILIEIEKIYKINKDYSTSLSLNSSSINFL